MSQSTYVCMFICIYVCFQGFTDLLERNTFLPVNNLVIGVMDISGTWRNQLGSTMTIVIEDDEGYVSLSGAYCTGVSRVHLTAPGFPLHGTLGREAAPTSVGFTVTFQVSIMC